MAQHGKLVTQPPGNPDVLLQQRPEGNRIHVYDPLELQILAEGQPRQRIGGLSTRKIAAPLLQLQKRRSGIDDMQPVKVVIYAFDEILPVLEFVDLIEEQVRCSMSKMVFRQGIDLTRIDPDIIKRHVKPLFRPQRLLHVLKHHRRLADASRTLDANQTGIPIDILVEITLEIKRRIRNPFLGNAIDLVYDRILHDDSFRDSKPFSAENFGFSNPK